MNETDLDLVLKKFEKWVEERIMDLSVYPADSSVWQVEDDAKRIEALKWAKRNLRRIIKEIKEASK